MRLNKPKNKLKSAVLLCLIFLLFTVGCTSNREEVQALNTNAQVQEKDHLLSLEEAKRIILQAENDIKMLKEQEGESSHLGYYGVSPVYGLSPSSRQELESVLSTYFSQEIMFYVLITHEIVCTKQECGNYGDSEGQYVVNPEGNFTLLEQTDQVTVIQVPFTFKGINEHGEFTDTYGTYTFLRDKEGFLITDISQEYNDSLFKDVDEDELLVLEITEEMFFNNDWDFDTTVAPCEMPDLTGVGEVGAAFEAWLEQNVKDYSEAGVDEAYAELGQCYTDKLNDFLVENNSLKDLAIELRTSISDVNTYWFELHYYEDGGGTMWSHLSGRQGSTIDAAIYGYLRQQGSEKGQVSQNAEFNKLLQQLSEYRDYYRQNSVQALNEDDQAQVDAAKEQLVESYDELIDVMSQLAPNRAAVDLLEYLSSYRAGE